MSRMTVRQLEAFLAVLETGSVTRAAEVLRVSQPSISKLLQELEAAIDLKLFDRVRKRLIPTIEARRLGLEVEDLYLKLSRIEHVANELRAKGVGELRVAALPALGFRVIPECLATFRKWYPGLRISLSVVPSQQVVKMVAEGEADVGFAYPVPGTPATLTRDSLAVVPAVLALPKGHVLGAKRRLALENLVEEPVIALGREDRSRDKLDMVVAAKRVLLTIVVETQFAAVACELAAAGGGIAIVDAVTANVYRDRVSVRPFDPSFDFDFGVLTRTGTAASPLVRKLVAIVGAVTGKLAAGERVLGAPFNAHSLRE